MESRRDSTSSGESSNSWASGQTGNGLKTLLKLQEMCQPNKDAINMLAMLHNSNEGKTNANDQTTTTTTTTPPEKQVPIGNSGAETKQRGTTDGEKSTSPKSKQSPPMELMRSQLLLNQVMSQIKSASTSPRQASSPKVETSKTLASSSPQASVASLSEVAAERLNQLATLANLELLRPHTMSRKRSIDSISSSGTDLMVGTDSNISLYGAPVVPLPQKNSFEKAQPKTTSAKPPAAKKPRRTGKLCSIPGCTTRDKGGGKCAKHGGGRPCKFEGCTKVVAGVRFCSAHGGTRKKMCSEPSCKKGDQGGGFCASHGGGRRCKIDNCTRRDIGRGLCWSHGGGRRCATANCLRCPSMNGYCKLHFSTAPNTNKNNDIDNTTTNLPPPPPVAPNVV